MSRLANIVMQAQAASDLADAVETSQRITWQGPLSLSQAVVLGVALVVLCGIALWGESRLTGRRVPLIFWPFRIIVLALVVWMLLEPTKTTVERRTERKSLAVIADASGSMDIIDPADTAVDLRWTTAAQHADSAVALCDRLLLTAGEALARLRDAEQLAGLPRSGERLRKNLDAALRASSRAQEFAKQLVASAQSLSADVAEQTQSLEVLIRTDVVPRVQDLLESTGEQTPQVRAAALRALRAKVEQAGQSVRGIASSVLDEAMASAALPSGAISQNVQSRREKVTGVLEQGEATWLGAAEENARVQRWTFDDEVTAVSANQWRPSGVVDPLADPDDGPPLTNLTALLEQMGRSAASERLEAVILLTDGRHNTAAARDPVEIAGSLGQLPVYVVPVGDDRMLRDLIVHHLAAPRAVARDDKIFLEALVTAIDCAGERIQVDLIAKDRFDNEEIIDQQEFTPDDSRIDERVSFTTRRDEVGRYEFLVRAKPIADEASPDNNAESISVDVVETEITVLLADDAPRWEFRYLSRLFERDEHVEYDQLLFKPTPAGTGDLAQTLQLPTEVDEWSRYRVVMLGDVTPSQLPRSAQLGLRDFVTERGGTLILIAGPHAMPDAFADQPLGELLPVEPDAPSPSNATYAVAITAEGRLSPAIQVADDPLESERAWQDAFRFTPVPWLSDYRRPKPTAHTLLRAVNTNGAGGDDQNAMLCWQSIGRGRVIYCSAPDSYRLRARHGDRYHHAFWGQLLRWSIAPELAAGSKTVRIRTDKQRYHVGEPVQATVELRDTDGEPVPLARVRAVAEQYAQAVAQIDLESDPNVPGQYIGRFDQLPDGPLTIRPVGEDVTRLLASESYTDDVTSPIAVLRELNAEMNDTRSNPALLARIAELTGGQVIPPTAVSEVPHLVALAPNVIETQSHQPLWNRWWCLAVLSGCLIIEWIARKRMSLL